MSMESNSVKSKRLVKNTFFLYIRMFILMGVSLYLSRVVLNALGVQDFGIYNVVGGVVALFSILCGSLSAAISRFIAFELGKNDENRLKEVFSISITVQIVLSLFVLLLFETVGLYFLNTKIDIPENRIDVAFWCYQFSVITFIVNLLSIPYNACIIAHEHMSTFARISLLEGFGKLFVAWGLLIYGGDRLFLYALMLMLLALLIRLIYGIYCKKNFAECKFALSKNYSLLKEIFAFAGWNFIGAATDPLCIYGRTVLLNMFFGPVLNAAYGIAMQVGVAISSFSSNFIMALKPQIIKAYAEDNKDYFFGLLFWGAKCSFFVLLLFSLPIIFNVEFVLKIWLKTFPDYTSAFIVLTLINIIIDSVSQPLVMAMLATGNIRNYQIVVGGCALLNVPISYIWLRCGGSPTCVFLVTIGITQTCFFLRLYMLRGMIGLPVGKFITNVYVRLALSTIVTFVVTKKVVLLIQIENEFLNALGISLLSMFWASLVMLFVGCSKAERFIIKQKSWNLLNKLYKKLKTRLNRA